MLVVLWIGLLWETEDLESVPEFEVPFGLVLYLVLVAAAVPVAVPWLPSILLREAPVAVPAAVIADVRPALLALVLPAPVELGLVPRVLV